STGALVLATGSSTNLGGLCSVLALFFLPPLCVFLPWPELPGGPPRPIRLCADLLPPACALPLRPCAFLRPPAGGTPLRGGGAPRLRVSTRPVRPPAPHATGKYP